ncbi:unnamed protein product, partial [Meganyctiphanes norvegica]
IHEEPVAFTERTYPCKYCDKAFANNKQLIANQDKHIRVMIRKLDHRQEHCMKKLYQCNQYEKALLVKNVIINKMKSHHGDKPYRCKKCDQKFSHNSAMLSHMKAHTRENQYQCNQCYKKFSLKKSLIRHMKTHNKTYKCNQCDKA